MSKEKYMPILAAITYSTIFGLSFMFSKIGLEVMTPMELISYRFLLGALVMTIFKLFKIVDIDLEGKDIKIVVFSSIFQPVLYFIFEILGVNMTTTSEAGLMISLIPVVVAIFSVIFLKEELVKEQWVFIGLSVFGVILINIMRGRTAGTGNYLGIIFLFLAVLSAGFYNIGAKKSSAYFRPVEMTYIMMWVAAICFNTILIGINLKNGTMNSYFSAILNMKSIVALLYLGILSSIVAFFLVNYSISRMSLTQSAVFGNISTIVSIMAGVLVLKEDFSWYDFVGAVMIIVGVWGTVYFGWKKAIE